MHETEAKKVIIDGVAVTRQKVAIMKRLILEHGTLDNALKHISASMPVQVVIHSQIDPAPVLRAASDWISFSLAGCEAIWDLIHSGALVQTSSNLTSISTSIGWTTVHGNSGGSSGGWDFDFESAYPTRFVKSWTSDRNQVLADADLYLQKLSLPNLHGEVEAALRDAVRCFRAELFIPAVVMLGKASEGIWIELGVVLSVFVGAGDPKAKKWAESLVGPDVGFAKKLREIISYYETRQNAFKPLAQEVGISLDDVRSF